MDKVPDLKREVCEIIVGQDRFGTRAFLQQCGFVRFR